MFDASESVETLDKRPISKKTAILSWLVLCVFGLLVIIWYGRLVNQPPADFMITEPLIIESGLPARDIIISLKDTGYVNSAAWLYLVLALRFGAENIKAGVYTIEEPLTTYHLAKLITASAPPSLTVSVTFPEGFTAKEYAKIASEALTDFDTVAFIELAEAKEGQLFPDTYAVPPDFTAQELFELLRSTYETKIGPLRPQMSDQKLTELGIINLASIVEREANTEESMRLVAGILDKRLALGMPLQADATMEYILQKPLKELTAEDLKIDTPYNTYLYKGLPPTPIGNPGLDSIAAVLNPMPSDYLFYLTDENGQFHYAATYDEHQRNIARYLQ